MVTREDHTWEVTRVRRQLAKLKEQVTRNTGILKQSQARELALLQAEDLAGLFRQMLAGLAASYKLQQVTVVLCDPDHDIRHLLLAAGTKPEDFPGLGFVESLSGLLPAYVSLRKPWLGAFQKDHELIFGHGAALKSIAMLPLMHKGMLIGCLNFGSTDASRFTTDHATDFFSHLGAIASFALENAVNRARLLRSGFTDVLTGWHNRRYLQERLTEELARARRDGETLVCLMLDLDHFKKINDTHGHAAGDEVLRELAQRIEAQVRASDVAARYGGEEFVILLPHTDLDSAALLAERIRLTVCGCPVPFEGGREVSVTASIGIASVSPRPEDSDLKSLGDGVLARADVALYRAKSAGRDRVVLGTDG
jgi:two-component system, cell cycle response regulator